MSDLESEVTLESPKAKAVKVASTVIEERLAGKLNSDATHDQVAFVDQVNNAVRSSEVIELENASIVVPEGVEADEQIIDDLSDVLAVWPGKMDEMLGLERQPTHRTIIMIDEDWTKSVDGTAFFAHGGLMETDEDTSVSYVLTSFDGKPMAPSYVVHELFHEGVETRTDTAPTFFDEGLSELVTAVYMEEGMDFLKDPQATLERVIEKDPYSLMGRKASLGTPLLRPELLTNKRDGGYKDWVRKYIQNKEEVGEDEVQDWIKTGEFRGQRGGSTCLQVELDYCFGKAVCIQLINEGVGIDEIAQIVANNYPEDYDDRTKATIGEFQSKGVDLVGTFNLAMNMTRNNLTRNYDYEGQGDIVDRYLEIVDEFDKDTTRDEAKRSARESGITWK